MERAGAGPRKVCTNVKCGTSSSSSWKPGWFLRSGHLCELCDSCGSIFEQGRFCETFHSDDAGWRTCNSCKKRVHCGCIASLYSFVLLDAGGVECVGCAKKGGSGVGFKHVQQLVPPTPRLLDPTAFHGWSELFGSRTARNVEAGPWQPFSSTWYPPNGVGITRPSPERPGESNTLESGLKVDGGNARSVQADNRNASATKATSLPRESSPIDNSESDQYGGENVQEGSPVQFPKGSSVQMEAGLGTGDEDSALVGLSVGLQPGLSVADDSSTKSGGKVSPEPFRGSPGKGLFLGKETPMAGPTTGFTTLGGGSRKEGIAESSQQSSLGASCGGGSPSSGGAAAVSADTRDLASKFAGLSSHRARQRHLLPRFYHPVTSPPTTNAETRSGETGSVRVARPPGQGRGRNQLLPRYWPRITDQELRQITNGDSNATITPLFEKMLSASDAGRIGRLVLPKACAEAYFPSISQPEGLPMKIQDITGKEWVFQFRFWPNNNSRMYVLEGVTPCIQSMQLQAGDTVTFSRLDPEGKLVMGYRRAPASLSSQEPKGSTRGTSAIIPAASAGGHVDNLYGNTGSALLPVNANTEARVKSGQNDVSDAGYCWSKAERANAKESSMLEAMAVDRKQGRPLGGKSKRLRLENEDSVELKTSWEEAQELLRPPPSIVPSVVTIEGYQFEEYEEPPVCSKQTINTVRQSGEQDQWAQCDECENWRRVPPDVVVPARWTCSDNYWDLKRSMCSAPQELSNDDIEHLLGLAPGEELAIQDTADRAGGQAGLMAIEPSGGLDALANAAALGETARASTSPTSPARTTKHPRHRPGCTCIVCIQPPSGKGPKHKQNCLCNVCVTVKRRFKTLMLRRKKRLSEREAEGSVRRKRKDEVEVNSGSKLSTDVVSLSDGGRQESFVGAVADGSCWNDGANGDGAIADGPRWNDGANGDVSNRSAFAPFTVAFSNLKTADESPVSKGQIDLNQIDLNSHPEREEEPMKVVGMVSMKQLLQDASLPLETYLKQQGMTSLFESHSVESSGQADQEEKKSGEQSSSQSQDHSHEEASSTRVHGDTSGVPIQAGAQNPAEMEPMMCLGQDDTTLCTVSCNTKALETFSPQPGLHAKENRLHNHQSVNLRGNFSCRSPTRVPERSEDSLHSSTSKDSL